METKKNIIDVEQLKLVVTEIFDIFGKYQLNKGEIEFVVDELKKLTRDFGRENARTQTKTRVKFA